MRGLAYVVVVAMAGAGAASEAEPLEVTYLGTAGWQIRSGETVILVDPLYSRQKPVDSKTPISPDPKAIEKYAPPKAKLVLVAHSHWDHVLDAPLVATRTGADLLGSESTMNYAKAVGLSADRIVPVRGGEDYAFDGFSVKVIPGLHSALFNKHWIGGGLIPRDVKPPLAEDDFAEGGSYNYLVRIAGHQLLFISSANFIERELAGVKPDVAFVAVGLRQEIHDYTCRLLATIGKPRLVFTNHFDDFTAPYEVARAAHAADVERLAPFAAEVRACSPRTEVRVPRQLDPVRL